MGRGRWDYCLPRHEHEMVAVVVVVVVVVVGRLTIVYATSMRWW